MDLHGRKFAPTWTRLSETADAGSRGIVLQDDVDWRVGQHIVVTTSIFKDEFDNQNEVRAIAEVSEDGRRLVLDSPLTFHHYGGPEYQCEVALLSRSILIQGAPSTKASKVGPHIRLQKPSRIRGVQAFRAGQLNVMGAYPFHFHMVGDGEDSYFTDNSVYQSYYRCYTVHGTNGALVKDNVGFDVNGHCFYVEDGVEEGNQVSGFLN